MIDIMVIGYGNELRGDDALGPRVAEAIAAENHRGVGVRTVHQLLPELAAELAEVRTVIFVDALTDLCRETMELSPVQAEETTDWCTHTAHPRTLLVLTRTVYGRGPEGWWLTIPGRSFDFGEGLSAAAEENMRRAVVLLNQLIEVKSLGRA